MAESMQVKHCKEKLGESGSADIGKVDLRGKLMLIYIQVRGLSIVYRNMFLEIFKIWIDDVQNLLTL